MADESNESLSTLSSNTENLLESKLMSDIEEIGLSDNPLMAILDKTMILPGVKINRSVFLMETYHLSGTEVENEDIFESISLEQMDTAASKFITTNITQSSAAAFVLGLPGGFAMAATIPVDIMQNFAFSLRLAQQLAYIYGFGDLFADSNDMNDKTRNALIAFLGIMFAASGSGSVLRAIAPNVGKYAARQALKTPLTKTVWYPMLKKIANIVASKTITAKGVSGFVSKAIPVVGGVVSAGINVATMTPMANRLKNELRKYNLSEDEILEIEEKDKIAFSELASDIISDIAAGTVKTATKVKGAGKNLGEFAKQISIKTKEKINENKGL